MSATPDAAATPAQMAEGYNDAYWNRLRTATGGPKHVCGLLALPRRCWGPNGHDSRVPAVTLLRVRGRQAQPEPGRGAESLEPSRCCMFNLIWNPVALDNVQ